MRATSLIALAIGFIVTRCGGGENSIEPPRNPCELARGIRPSASFLGVPEEADIGTRVLGGGFGGLYQEMWPTRSGNLVAYFKDVSASSQLRTDLRKLLVCGGIYPGWADELVETGLDSITVRQGLYTGSELLSYSRALEPLRSDPDVWAMEIDPTANRVWIGLANASAGSRIQQAVQARAVPSPAVHIEVPPPTNGDEQFEILNSPVRTVDAGLFGVLFFPLRVRFTNRQTSVRYPDWCINQDLQAFTEYFAHMIQQWDGSKWNEVEEPFCVLVLLTPRPVAPGESATDSVPVVGSRRLRGIPYWRTARITGTYRLVGKVFRSATPNPSGGPAFVSDPAPPNEQFSVPFRVINTLPF